VRLLFFVIILGLIAVIPFGVWVSIGIFSIWLFNKLKSLDGVQVKIIQKNQYDPDILEQMK